jgi:P-type Mg2+ transporter
MSAALTADAVAAASVEQVLNWLDSAEAGLSGAQAAERLARLGPNAIRTHRVSGWAVLARQFRNAVLILLVVTAVASYFLGDRTDAVIIAVILAVSVGLGFVNEYRAERTAASLQSQVHHSAVVRRDGTFVEVDVTHVVRGDVVRLSLGDAVPADVRLIETTALECDESILSGESMGSEKSPVPVPAGVALTDMSDVAFMGTIVSAGEGLAVVYATGKDAQFGRIAEGLGERAPETDFQAGLAAPVRFSASATEAHCQPISSTHTHHDGRGSPKQVTCPLRREAVSAGVGVGRQRRRRGIARFRE